MAAQPEVQGLEKRNNEWGHEEHFRERTFMKVDDLKRICNNQYFIKRVAEHDEIPENYNTVPHYPRPVEFHVSEIVHVTTEKGLAGIMAYDGFKKGKTDFLWCGLVIGQEERTAAEQRYLEALFPDRSQEQERRQNPFLHNFTTSPVFQDHESRYGNFRFSFSLADVLQAYRTQLCGNQEPVLRVYKTAVYRQEVMYVVLIHSPDVHDYDDYPVLGNNDDGVCAYRNGEIIWHAQAISETHSFRLIENRQENHVDAVRSIQTFYVWDHVTLAFHMPEGKVLEFPHEKLLESLTAGGSAAVQVDRSRPKLHKNQAEEIVNTYKA